MANINEIKDLFRGTFSLFVYIVLVAVTFVLGFMGKITYIEMFICLCILTMLVRIKYKINGVF